MIVLPDMPEEQTASWLGILDVYNVLPEGWTLIGGQLVHLHCAERGQFPERPTNDADTVLDVHADPTILEDSARGRSRALHPTSEGRGRPATREPPLRIRHRRPPRSAPVSSARGRLSPPSSGTTTCSTALVRHGSGDPGINQRMSRTGQARSGRLLLYCHYEGRADGRGVVGSSEGSRGVGRPTGGPPRSRSGDV